MENYAVLGNPVQHSLSPLIHHLFAEQTQQALTYTAELVPLQGLAQALTDFQNKGGKGVNITAPFKEAAFFLVDEVSPRAQQAGVINTIRFESSGKRFGDNTDGVGLVKDIQVNHGITLFQKTILINGAGGAVCAILPALLAENPARIVIVNRTPARAEALADRYVWCKKVQFSTFSQLETLSFGMILNAVCSDLPENGALLPRTLLKPGLFCYDLSYGSRAANFLKWANEPETTVKDGRGMLIEQAAEAFYTWRGVRPCTRNVFFKINQALSSSL